MSKLCRKLLLSKAQAIQLSTINNGAEVRGLKNFEETLIMEKRNKYNTNYKI